MFYVGFVAGAALAATASWFYYTHAIARRVEAAVAQVNTTVGFLVKKA